jgi:hypothetical protein
VKIGPFFYIKGKLFFNACSLSEGRKQADKIDNSYGHDQLYDDHFKSGDYIDYPRGRVVWDCTNNKAIIYIDPCIKKANVIEKIKKAFELTEYDLSEDDHYHCKKCVGSLFED